MRIRALDVTRFGALSDRRFKLDRKAVVVYGPNEAGKSSFHAAIETALYGFSPANRESHPYARWDEDSSLELVAQVETRSGERLLVERTLRAAPGTRIVPAGEELVGPRRGNNALPGLEPFPRTLFRAVYSLTANDTTFQKDEVREHVSELLLGERGLENARPIREVRTRLHDDHTALWRATERGKPVAKELRAALRVAQKEEREARRHERSLREEAIEQANLLAEREQLASRRVGLRREETEADFLEAIAELRARMDDVRPLRTEGLKGGPMEDPAPLREELALLKVELEAPRARLAEEPTRLALFDRKLLASMEEVEGLLRAAPGHAAERERRDASLHRAEGAMRSARERLDRTGTGARELEPFEALDLGPLERGLALWQEEIADQSGSLESALPARLLLGVALACLTLAVTGLTPSWVAVGALAAVPVVLRRDREANRIPAPLALQQALAQLELPAMESPLALRRTLADLGDARQLLAEARREREAAARLDVELDAREADWRKLAAELSEPTDDLTELPQRLERALIEARRHERELAGQAERRERDKQQVASHRSRERKLEARVASLDATLAANFPGLDPDAAHAAWREAEQELEYVRRRERELRGDRRWGDLALDPRLGLEGDARPWSEASRRARAEELARLDLRLEELRERRGEIGAHLDGDPGSAVAEAAERAAHLEEELAHTLRQRDRLALLERVLVVAERAHREAHQPDVLQRAGEYLTLVTDGRYTGLCYPHGQEGPLCVQPADRDEPVPVDAPLSRGTREQVYLCLRLGTLDDLDRDREGLPVVLDEALVHWDEGRRAALYPLLARVAKRRQVILFTCHPDLAQEASEGLGAPVLDLQAGSLRS